MQIERLHQQYLECRAVSTDTRKIGEGTMFFALKGANFNGNAFAGDALAKGARYAVVDEAAYCTSDRHILVDDVLKALQQLANYHRRTLGIPFIGITGSNGKTTTKELVNAVLSKKFRTHATQGNLNNHIGVPLTLLNMPKDTEIAVVEMGANRVGDIAELCAIAEPTHGIITNIGHAHLEGFGGPEGVLKGKTELYDSLVRHGGTALINSQDTLLSNTGRVFKTVLYYGSPGDFMYGQLVEASPYIVYRDENGEVRETQLLGAYNFSNILVALAFGKMFGVPAEAAHQAVGGYVPSNNRSQVMKAGSNTIVLDAYNANPSSMKVALENFKGLEAEKKIVIIGDMFELGTYSIEKHREIIQLAASLGFAYVLVCGHHFEAAHQPGDGVICFKEKSGVVQWLEQHPVQKSHVLIKASRGMGLESLVELLNS